MWKASKKYFLSFIEEAVMNPDYEGYVAGRVEVYEADAGEYAKEEIRFFTKKLSEFYRLRDTWDFKEVSAGKLEQLRKELSGYLEKT